MGNKRIDVTIRLLATVVLGLACTQCPSKPGDNTIEPECGNGLCETDDGENRQACPQDCTSASLAAGEVHVCATAADYTVWCWGLNNLGQLGNGQSHQTCQGGQDCSNLPTEVQGLPEAYGLYGGIGFLCAAVTYGALYCWGTNEYGQIGDGTDVSHPVAVLSSGISSVRSAAGGLLHTCAVKADGTVWCWGGNTGCGLLGDGVSSHQSCDQSDCSFAPVRVAGLHDTLSVAAGDMHTCAVKADGTVWCWGCNTTGALGFDPLEGPDFCPDPCSRTPHQIAGFNGAVQVTLGWNHGCALKSDGTAWCWGRNEEGQLGDGTDEPSYTPVQAVGLSQVRFVAAGSIHTCALQADGRVFCWGNGNDGKLGHGGENDSYSPVEVVGLANAELLTSGSSFSCAMTSDGAVWCWGQGEYGQMGNGSFDSSSVPVRVSTPF